MSKDGTSDDIMKFHSRWAIGIVSAIFMLVARPASQVHNSVYALFPGDFNGDGRTDLLYVGRSVNAPSGIALADESGAPQMGFQSWSQTYLGINWSLDYIQPVIGDFNGDGSDDVLLQSKAEDPSYVILANTKSTAGPLGQFLGISQAISPTAMGLNWPARYHKLIAGDFDGDGKDDLLMQAALRGGTSAIVLADAQGRLFTREGSNCWKAGPQQCWGDGELGFQWSTADSTVAVGDFDGDGNSDVLIQGWPEFVQDESRDPPWVETFRPMSFGVVLSVTEDKSGRILRSANQLWNVEGLGTNWSPLLRSPIVADFSGDGRADVLLQGLSSGTPNQLVLAGAQGLLGEATTLKGEPAEWSADATQLIPGRFGNGKHAGFYLQALNSEGTNGYVADISGSNADLVPSMLQAPNSEGGLTGDGGDGGGMSLQMAVTPPSEPSPPTAVGAIPASASVSQNGTANYSIAIKLPAGTAGLTPDLALTYSSGSGNGLVGMGWSLTGLGTIARCPRSIAQDGFTLGVQLTSEDQYCLNGNRLNLVSGTRGLAGAIYRTELETYSRVTILSAITSGPSSWKVERKDGLIEEYGGTADSRIAILGNSATYRSWALSRVSDRASNFWSVTYTNEVATNGSYRPLSIDYTGNSLQGTSAPYQVLFTYGPRNSGENVVSYYGGGLINQSKRLTQIEYRYQGVMKRKYVLSYQASPPDFNLASRLAFVQECSPSACMAETTFGWSNTQMSGGGPALGAPVAEYGFGGGVTTSDPPPYYASDRNYTLDINGDGIPDAASVNYTNYNGAISVGLALFVGTATGQVATTYAGSYEGADGAERGVYDLDEDGKEDLPLGTKYLRQRPDGTYALDAIPTSFPITGFQIDVDGDGFNDSINFNGALTQLILRFHKHDNTLGFEATTSTAWAAPGGTTILANQFEIDLNNYTTRQAILQSDINADGRGDLLVQTNGGWRVLYSNGAGFDTGELIVPVSGSINGSTVYFPPVLIDMNGDGCTDFAYPKTSGGQNYWYLAISTCRTNGLGLSIDVPTGIAVTGLGMNLNLNDTGSGGAADINGDGNQDLISGSAVLLSNGLTLVPYTSWVGTADYRQLWADRNGDGVLDFVTCDIYGACYQTKHGLGKRPNHLVSAVDGFGKSVAFEYVPLTDSSVYMRGTGTSGETQDMQSPMYVVKTMTLSNGIGGTFSETYYYSGAKRNIAGRGFLGFAGRLLTDSRTNFVTQETYNNSVSNAGLGWDVIGTLASSVTRQSVGGPIVSDVAQTWLSIVPTGSASSLYPYVFQKVSKRYELTGVNTPIATSTTTTTVDGYGTEYDITTTVVEGGTGLSPGSTATERKYTPLGFVLNDASSWCLSRPQRVEDIRSHTLTDGTSQTRIAAQTWDTSKCRVTNVSVAPGSGWESNTALEYDLFNNIKKSAITGDSIGSAPVISQASFGANGHLQESSTNAKNHQTTFTWDVGLGVRLTQLDPNSLTTSWQYDDFGRERLVTRPDGTKLATYYYLCNAANSNCGDSLLRYVVRKSEQKTTGTEINHLDQFFDQLGRVKYEQTVGF